MSDTKSKTTKTASSSTDTVTARVEGTDKQGRVRILRVFYDDYKPGDDKRGRAHVELPADAIKQ